MARWQVAILVVAAACVAPATGHGGHLHPPNAGSFPGQDMQPVLLARCASFQIYEPDLATTLVAPHVSSTAELDVSGSIDVYAYVDGACQPTSALRPSLHFSVSSSQGGGQGGKEDGSGSGAEQGGSRRPWSGKATGAYGFSGTCASGLNGLYQHHPTAGYNRNNLLWWHSAATDADGALLGTAPSGANTLPRRDAADAPAGAADASAASPSTPVSGRRARVAQGAQQPSGGGPQGTGVSPGGGAPLTSDPAALASTALQSILLVPSEGMPLCCNVEWEADAADRLASTSCSSSSSSSSGDSSSASSAQMSDSSTSTSALMESTHSNGLAGSSSSSSSAPDDCPDTPSRPECADYKYPASRAEGDLDALCSAMPDMPGCSVRHACQDGKLPSSPVCHPLTLLATICSDMPGMGGCGTYNKMCGDDSVIEECAVHPAIRRTPSWSAAREAVFSMCKDHPMEQCASCTESHCPDPLGSLSGACTDMPDMPECRMYDRWCEVNDDGRLSYYCGGEGGGTSSGLPAMKMYFHGRISEVVLWRSWVPNSLGSYVATLLVVVLFGIISIATKTCTTLLSIWWKLQAVTSVHAAMPCAPPSSSAQMLPRGSQWWQNATKALLTGVSVVFDYWNMLIAMTFNIGLFSAVIVGYVMGAFLFASIPDNFTRQMQNVFVDCECPRTNNGGAYSSSADEAERDEDAEAKHPLNPQSKQHGSKSCCKATKKATNASMACHGGDIEASNAQRAFNNAVEGALQTTPACCPDIH